MGGAERWEGARLLPGRGARAVAGSFRASVLLAPRLLHRVAPASRGRPPRPMSKPPQAVLSEHFQERMKGRRLLAAIFTTFRFEPAFFETEILPVFLDVPLSQAREIKWVQLEDALRPLSGKLSVYYDRNGLVADGGPAKLDVR